MDTEHGVDDIILTCACGKHAHPLSKRKACEQCQELAKELENDMEYQTLLKKYKRTN